MTKPVQEAALPASSPPKPSSPRLDNGSGTDIVTAAAVTADAANAPQAAASSSGAWTSDQDATLLRLKAANTSWKDIAAAMSRAKSAVRTRFKELQREEGSNDSRNAGGETAGAGKSGDGREESWNGGMESWGGVEDGVDEGRAGGAEKEDRAEGESDSGSGGRLKADANWTEVDCAILEMLEARYREQKWLSLQASFYNLTGRMVVAEMIERKLMEARD